MDPLIQILKRLDEQELSFVRIGGMAAIAHGSPMMTRDVDICGPLGDASLGKIIEALRGLHPGLRFRPDKVFPVDSVAKFSGFGNPYISTDWGA
jgi:hypothetical protein